MIRISDSISDFSKETNPKLTLKYRARFRFMSFYRPLYQSDACCTTIRMKMSFINWATLRHAQFNSSSKNEHYQLLTQ